jgi:SAM-dependent methyltransferase
MGREDLFEYSDGKRFLGKKNKDIFKHIVKENIWKESESVSGPGSSLEQTLEIRNYIPDLLKNFQISSMLDIPCGDFNWMQLVNLGNTEYVGADIVQNLITENNRKYRSATREFLRLDLINDDLGKFDLIFCRDCLVHFSYHDIMEALQNFKRSKSTYLMTTTFTEEKENKDIPTGGWRPLNFEKEPFKFGKPLYLLNEKCTEKNGVFADKSLGLWKINTI